MIPISWLDHLTKHKNMPVHSFYEKKSSYQILVKFLLVCIYKFLFLFQKEGSIISQFFAQYRLKEINITFHKGIDQNYSEANLSKRDVLFPHIIKYELDSVGCSSSLETRCPELCQNLIQIFVPLTLDTVLLSLDDISS